MLAKIVILMELILKQMELLNKHLEYLGNHILNEKEERKHGKD